MPTSSATIGDMSVSTPGAWMRLKQSPIRLWLRARPSGAKSTSVASSTLFVPGVRSKLTIAEVGWLNSTLDTSIGWLPEKSTPSRRADWMDPGCSSVRFTWPSSVTLPVVSSASWPPGLERSTCRSNEPVAVCV